MKEVKKKYKRKKHINKGHPNTIKMNGIENSSNTIDTNVKVGLKFSTVLTYAQKRASLTQHAVL